MLTAVPVFYPEFQQLPPEPKWGKLAELAQQYHAECDAYDAGVCTGKSLSGEPFPANSYERSLCFRNAKAVRATKLTAALQIGCTETDFQKALIEWAGRPRSKA